MKSAFFKNVTNWLKKNKSSALVVFLFFVGLGILLYPTISNSINERHQSTALVNYETELLHMQEEEKEQDWRAAQAYNQELLKIKDPLSNKDVVPGYDNILSYDINGLMGYIIIDKIGVQLPIYHGTDESILGIGAGHIQGSSFPVGGENTHAVLSGHTGLPGSKLFTDLSKLKEGDKFQISILDRVLTYKVDQIKVVLPDETEDLEIIEGKDYVTLTTCTPYGINSHRLLVRGTRIADEKPMLVTQPISPITLALRIALGISVMLFVFSLLYLVRSVRMANKDEKGGEDIENKKID